MNDDIFDARTYGLLAEFDSLGFIPSLRQKGGLQ